MTNTVTDTNCPAPKAGYHHGSLRESLLAAAMQTLLSDGMDKLSLRGLAKQVGVSATAVYSHFQDKVDLLIDLRTQGFHHLSAQLQSAIDNNADKPGDEKVRALGFAYMDFAAEQPHLFDILFSWTPDVDRMKPDCVAAGIASECLLQDAICQMFRERGVEPTEYQAAVASFSAWSQVHGLTMLVRSGSIEGAVICGNWPEIFSSQHPKAQQRVFEHLLTTQIEGLKASVDRLIP